MRVLFIQQDPDQLVAETAARSAEARARARRLVAAFLALGGPHDHQRAHRIHS